MSCLLLSCRPELSFVDGSFLSSEASLSGGGEQVTVLFNREAGRASIDLSASGEWTAEFVNGRAYWCQLSADKGKRGVATLVISVEENGEYDERSASILFTCRDLKRTIVVVQKQRDALLLSSDRVEMEAEGGSFTVDVMANVDFSHQVAPDGSAWIHPVTSKGLSKSSLTFQVDPNGELTRRNSQVSFASAAGTETVQVYQKGEQPTILLSGEDVLLPAEEGIFKVEVASNIDVSFEVPADCKWLREVQTKTISTRTYTFAYDRNHSRRLRECRLDFHNDAYGKTETVRISQTPAEILVDMHDLYLPSRGVEFSVRTVPEIKSFTQFTFDAAWLEPLRMESDDRGPVFRFRVGPNPQRDFREVYVEVRRPGYDQPETFAVCQFGQYPAVSYTVADDEGWVPEIRESNSAYLVDWGDGSFEPYAASLTHRYQAAGPHTVCIEGLSFPFVFFPAPGDGMHFDFSRLNLK